MCTLTYILHEQGCELFFNRDEQRSRPIALPPQRVNIKTVDNERGNVESNKQQLKPSQTTNSATITATYPIDPTGKGTWLAVTEKGLSLALLNNYQAAVHVATNASSKLISRGQLILTLLQSNTPIEQQLNNMDLKQYNPFQLCIFPEGLTANKEAVRSLKWDGQSLSSPVFSLPITSSSVDFDNVVQKRRQKFEALVSKDIACNNTSAQHKTFHYSSDSAGKYSVNMRRDDAMTVSISHISVTSEGNNKINASPEVTFDYFDNVKKVMHYI